MGYYDPYSPDFPFTIGIEEEYQIIDPQTWELRSYITQILEEGQLILREQMKPEMMQSVVEVGTHVCRTSAEARAEITRLRSVIAGLAARKGMTIAAAGTHPFSSWLAQEIYPHERYFGVVNEMQDAARRLLIFGMHIHIGVPDAEIGIQLQNVARYFLPHLLALSTSSPFWMGRLTGFKSYRSIIFSNFPRTGIPGIYNSMAEFQSYVDLLIKTGSIDNGKKIWWDIRPHPIFGTIEIRMCDIATRVDEAVALAALVQAIFVKLYKLFEQNMTFRVYNRALINENKWRAVRYGLDGELIDFGKQKALPARSLLRELVAFVDDVVDDLGSRKDIEYIYRILEEGTSADRQLAVYHETGDLKAVVEQVVRETLEGVPVDSPGAPR
ncbi:MAG: putative glutamate--cysteine ligase 2 [Herpetosiphonaceae bacterium]|nr:MAG: putative glutamate--cysteine ligase 2 [Herpetosiphonaceae bacterium]